MGLFDKSISLKIPEIKTPTGKDLTNYMATSSYQPGIVASGNEKTGGWLKNLDPAMKFDLGLAGLDVLGLTAMGLQSIYAEKPKVSRTPIPRLTTPILNDSFAAEEALIKENLGTQTNTLLNYSMEHGKDIGENVGIFANANRVMRESTAAISGKKRDVSNQQNMITADTENKNLMLEYEGTREYLTRKDQILGQDALMRGQQLSQAVSGFSQVGSRLMNDFMLTNLIKEGNERDTMAAKMWAMNQALPG